MSNQENTNVKALQELYEFGMKCYKKGYRRATFDVYAGIGCAAIMLLSLALIDKAARRKDKN